MNHSAGPSDPAQPGPMKNLPRRRFLDVFLGTSTMALLASILYPVIRFVSPPRLPEATSNRVLAGKVSEMAQAKWKTFPFGSEAGILVATGPGQYKAMSATCTHLQCTVQYETSSKRIWCACHNGWYDLEGRNVGGPPPRPLTAYSVQVVGDEIFVVRS